MRRKWIIAVAGVSVLALFSLWMWKCGGVTGADSTLGSAKEAGNTLTEGGWESIPAGAQAQEDPNSSQDPLSSGDESGAEQSEEKGAELPVMTEAGVSGGMAESSGTKSAAGGGVSSQSVKASGNVGDGAAVQSSETSGNAEGVSVQSSGRSGDMGGGVTAQSLGTSGNLGDGKSTTTVGEEKRNSESEASAGALAGAASAGETGNNANSNANPPGSSGGSQTGGNAGAGSGGASEPPKGDNKNPVREPGHVIVDQGGSTSASGRDSESVELPPDFVME